MFLLSQKLFFRDFEAQYFEERKIQFDVINQLNLNIYENSNIHETADQFFETKLVLTVNPTIVSLIFDSKSYFDIQRFMKWTTKRDCP